ncbi:FAD-dependent monooxygenase [Actinomadura atramentaria]|uniref:FAD-dependent monooxygenase n=1 Tax=Actinomadura atramentaria TaxID=1990 RepID=UPI000378006A|nr:FAD-dependent monooxygenase [Actinomadura atramentaria]
MSARHRVERVVVGGGIGGLTAALALARHGLPVHVLEQAPEFGEIGAGVQLAPNALRVLDRLGVLGDVLTSAVRPPKAVMMSAVTGEQITAIDFGEEFRAAYGHPYVVTHRSDLLAAVLDACRAEPAITLETGRSVRAVRQDGDTAVAECADGAEYRADALIGADGLWSAVRAHTVGDGDPAYIGDVAYRGTIPTAAISDRAGKEDMTWWIGPGLHLIQYPVRGGELFNQVAVFTAAAHGPAEEWGQPDELDRAFEATSDYVREGVRLVDRDRHWVLRDRPPAAAWSRGRATLLGDAAHPMAQYLAQGACQALEDAVALADLLAAHGPDVPAAFAAYEAERVPRTAKVQTWARRMGEIVHADGVTALLRDALLGGRDERDFQYTDWLYGHRTGAAPTERTP